MVLRIPFSLWINVCTSSTLYYLTSIYLRRIGALFIFFYIILYTPQNTSVSSFLGLAGYYKRFVKGFSMIAAPMTRLLQKNVRFEWSEKYQASFEKLKAFVT